MACNRLPVPREVVKDHLFSIGWDLNVNLIKSDTIKIVNDVNASLQELLRTSGQRIEASNALLCGLQVYFPQKPVEEQRLFLGQNLVTINDAITHATAMINLHGSEVV